MIYLIAVALSGLWTGRYEGDRHTAGEPPAPPGRVCAEEWPALTMDSACIRLLARLADSTEILTHRDISHMNACLHAAGQDTFLLYTGGGGGGTRSGCTEKQQVFIDFYHIPQFPGFRFVVAYAPGSKETTIYEPVDFVFSGHSTSEIRISFDYGFGSQVVTGPVTWQADLDMPHYRTLNFLVEKVRPNGTVDASARRKLQFRVKASPQGHRYRAPDDTWYIAGASYTPAPCQAAVLGVHDRQAGSAGAYVHVLYAHPDKKLRRPLLFIEGLDLGERQVCDPDYGGEVIRCGGLGWDTFISGLYENQQDEDVLALAPGMVDSLLSRGYDVLFVDFADGADWIQRNGECVISILQEVNDRKVEPQQNIVIGASMGGQIARWALAMMERRGLDHCSSTYVSFDSPQQGANISLGLQALLYFMARHTADDTGEQEAVWMGLHRPAPQQLLVQHFGRIESGTECIRAAYAAEIADLGYPRRVTNVGIACASGTATPVVPTGTGDPTASNLIWAEIFRGPGNPPCQPFLISINESAGRSQSVHVSDCNATLPYQDVILFAKIPTDFTRTGIGFIGDIPTDYSYIMVRRTGLRSLRIQVCEDTDEWGQNMVLDRTILFDNADIRGWDVAPGCYRDDFRTLLQPQLESTSDKIEVHRARPFCFMPVPSLLDIDTEDLYFGVKAAIPNQFTPDPGLTPFDVVFYTQGPNLAHVEITQEIVDWVLANVLEQTPLPAVLTARYNYAHHTQKQIPTTEILSGGQLVVNGEGKAAFDNVDVEKKNLYIAQTGGCGEVYVTVRSGGRVTVGEVADFRGRLIVNPEHTLHLMAGSVLEVNHGSELVIRPGARLIIESGAQVKLTHRGALQLAGTLELRGAVTVEAAGQVETWPGTVVEGPGSLRISGAYTPTAALGTTILRIHDGGPLVLDEVDLKLTDGTVRVGVAASLRIGEGRSADVRRALFLGDVPSPGGIQPGLPAATGLYARDYAAVYLEDCAFRLLACGIDLSRTVWEPGRQTLLYKIRTDNCLTGIRAARTGRLVLEASQLSGARHALPDSVAPDGIVLETADLYGRGLVLEDYDRGHGIYAPGMAGGQPQFNNVWLTHCSAVDRCHTGIRIDGGAGGLQHPLDWGLVHMSASRISYPVHSGVEGEDVLLSVDALLNPGQSHNTLLTCPPSQPGGLGPVICGSMFRICYRHRPAPFVAARGNYWGPPDSYGLPPVLYNLNGPMTPGGFCSQPVALRYTPFLASAPPAQSDCLDTRYPEDPHTDAKLTGGPQACDTILPGTMRTLSELYYRSYRAQMEGDTALARAGWQILVDHPVSVGDTCSHYRDYAAIYVPGLGLRRSSAEPESDAPDRLQCYPNPAGDRVTVRLPEGRWTLRLAHSAGTVLEEWRSREGDTELDISGWPPGVYLLLAQSEEEGHDLRPRAYVLKQ